VKELLYIWKALLTPVFHSHALSLQLLSTLDEGQAVDISSLPDARLKSLLENLFVALSLRRSPLGLYLLPENAPKTLQTLAPVLHDSVTSKSEPNGMGPSAVASHDQDAEKPLDQPDGPSVSHQKVAVEDKDGKSGAPVIGPALPPGKAQPSENGFNKRAGTSQPVIGPDLPNGVSEPAPRQEEVAEKVEIGPAGPPPVVKKRWVLVTRVLLEVDKIHPGTYALFLSVVDIAELHGYYEATSQPLNHLCGYQESCDFGDVRLSFGCSKKDVEARPHLVRNWQRKDLLPTRINNRCARPIHDDLSPKDTNAQQVLTILHGVWDRCRVCASCSCLDNASRVQV
jgi:hypothetical protein